MNKLVYKNFSFLIDQFLIFQFSVCDSNTKQMLPKSYFYFLAISMSLNLWQLLAVWILLMTFSVTTVSLGKVFPKVIGIPLTQFYKRHATPKVFDDYCGNPYSAIAGGAGKVLATGSSRAALAIIGGVFAQDAVHKAGIGQYPKYQFEKWSNGGTHPTGQPFLFKENGPSWGDSISRWKTPD